MSHRYIYLYSFSFFFINGLARRFQLSMNSLSQRIRTSVKAKFPESSSRVLECWDKFEKGDKLHRYIDDKKEVLQTADCFVDGLRAMCFHDTNHFSWIPGLEANYKAILTELIEYEYKRRGESQKVQVPTGIGNTAVGNVDIINRDLQELKPTGGGQEGDGLWMGPRYVYFLLVLIITPSIQTFQF